MTEAQTAGVETWPSLRKVLADLCSKLYDTDPLGDAEPAHIPFVNPGNVTERAGDEMTGTWMMPFDLDWWRVLVQDQAALADAGILLSPGALGVASTPDRDVLIMARRRRGEPVAFTAWRHRGNRLVPCCVAEEDAHPDSPGFDPWMDGPGLCVNFREPWSGRCADHQVKSDANWRLGAWRRANERTGDERDAAIRFAFVQGMTVEEIRSLTQVDPDEISRVIVEKPFTSL